MPLFIKDYTWQQTEITVDIVVPLKGVKKEKVDIFTVDDYLKVSFPPYLFEVVLLGPVKEDESSVLIQQGAVVFKLIKVHPGLWEDLKSPVMKDKQALLEKKSEAQEKHIAKTEEVAKLRDERIRATNKHALEKQMKLEQDERARIEGIKNQEREKATEELTAWKEEQQKTALQERAVLMEKAQIIQEETRRKIILEKIEKDKEEGDVFGSRVRDPGRIEVSFTQREFPTASRESTKLQEDEWLKKQAEARRVAELEDENLTEEEKNPTFMKEKGDQFFKLGDYRAATNAYTHAIRLSYGKLPSVFSNRAACHMKEGNLIKSVEDSSKALELLTPPVEQNRLSRFKAHVRRGTAFCQLELYFEGLQDYEAARKLCPDDEKVKEDCERIRQQVQSSSS